MRAIVLVLITLLVCPIMKGQNHDTDNQPSDRFTKGWNKLSEIDGEAGQKVIESLEEISPDLGKYVIEYPFGDVYGRNTLSDRDREIAVVAALTALGNAKPQLKVHLHAALNVGVTPDELKEIMILMSVYSGFPTALNGTFALQEVLQERSEKK